MPVIEELIRLNEDNTLSFGNYLVTEKKKVNEFTVSGDVYKLKTFKEITRLEKNGNLLIETIPGTSVHQFYMDEQELKFSIESNHSFVQITMELEAEQEYRISIDANDIGTFKTNLSGKLIFSNDFEDKPCTIHIKKV